jgi:hypothetical protein
VVTAILGQVEVLVILLDTLDRKPTTDRTLPLLGIEVALAVRRDTLNQKAVVPVDHLVTQGPVVQVHLEADQAEVVLQDHQDLVKHEKNIHRRIFSISHYRPSSI